jgi:azurin
MLTGDAWRLESSLHLTESMRNLWILALFAGVPAAFALPPASLSVSTAENNLQFVPGSLTVHAGQKVNLTFKNAASGSSDLEHTWTLVMPDKAEEVSAQSASAGAKQDYVMQSKDVLAHTHLVKPGKSETIHFTAPSKPGDYPYICTYPAHYPSMKGTLKVVP